MYCDIFDGLALSDVLSDPVNPKPFRLFAVGENALTKNGKKYVLTLSAEQIRSIAEYHCDKGEKIPLDSRHALLLAAEKAGVSETEAARAVPSKAAALGYAALKAEPDGLYAADIELLPLAQELFKAGSLRYYSPVIRGLDGKSPLRVTSIALDNVPALNNLDILAASAEDVHNPPDLDRSDLPGKTRKDSTMEKLEKALKALFPADALALSAETEEVIAGKLEALAAELPELRAAKAKVSELALSAEKAEKTALIDIWKIAPSDPAANSAPSGKKITVIGSVKSIPMVSRGKTQVKDYAEYRRTRPPRMVRPRQCHRGRNTYPDRRQCRRIP